MLPSSGTIKMSEVNAELKTSGSINLNRTDVRKLANKASGIIKMGDLHGKSYTKSVNTVIWEEYVQKSEKSTTIPYNIASGTLYFYNIGDNKIYFSIGNGGGSNSVSAGDTKTMACPKGSGTKISADSSSAGSTIKVTFIGEIYE